MTKGRKAKGSVNNDVEVYRHETDKRKNAVPRRLLICVEIHGIIF